MAKQANAAVESSFLRDLFSAGFYKRSQGRIARQATFGVLVLASALGAWSLKNELGSMAVPTVVFFAAAWLCFRLVQWPRFADFLISVEAEMNKVTWPTKSELYRSSVVVMVTIFGLAGVLFLYDFCWQFILSAVGVLGGSSTPPPAGG